MLNQAQLVAVEPHIASNPSLAIDAYLPSVEDGLVIAFLFVLMGCMILEKHRPLRATARTMMKTSYQFNLVTFFLNSLSLSLLSFPALYVAAESFSGHGLLSGLEDGFPKFLICLVLLDLTMYGWHYAMHHCDWLWTFHRLHHSDASLNVTSGLRFHPGELVLEVLVRCLFIMITGVDAGMALACQGVISLFGLLHHANARFPGEAWLSLIIVMPRMHRVHHSTLRSEHDSNYGEILTVWDRLFGTLKSLEPAAIGLPPARQLGLINAAWEALRALAMPAKVLVPIRILRHQTRDRRDGQAS
jgi:sterol desaturase/sphingolipid hydroxylase (fatty acid hydroxylase superfamily)